MIARLKDMVVTNARALVETTDPGYAFRYVDISSVNEGRIDLPAESIRFDSAPSRARRLADVGDTIVSTVRTYLRAVATVPATDDCLVFSTGFAVLHPRTERIDARYLGYICQSASFIDSLVARSVGVSYPVNLHAQLATPAPAVDGSGCLTNGRCQPRSAAACAQGDCPPT